ncbi:anthranilate synthase component I [Perlucidibaca piscinae]|uniref:anthranilate synthase component I n=1 Tax=Perlucidibaca piscinae TaxID=392589 RepID=UPI0003B43F09|nr:anthranilate synthase component I [Perlucidibaca piscinae]
MNAETFAALAARGFNRIPVVREILVDLDTPLSCYLKVADQPYTYLFESVQGGEQWGRYSMIGLPARTVLRITDHVATVHVDGVETERHEVADPLAFVEQFQQRYRVPDADDLLPGLPRFTGGLVGYFAYDTVRYIERRLAATRKPDPVGTPDIFFMVSDEVMVFDNVKGSLFLVVHADPAGSDALVQAERRLDALVEGIHARLGASSIDAFVPDRPTREADFVSSISESDFHAAVNRIKDYVLAGDIMQVVPSQRMSAPFVQPPLTLYRALRHLNPSPYMYFMHAGDFHIVGSSPEILARVEHGQVAVRPIAGTRKRGSTPERDRELEAELLADPKEIAEHLMLIDLGRNDVGRVAATGQVRVTEQMVVERYSHVMHIVSNVEATLKPGVTALDVLKATLPAGTLSGAPKVRAMEIIDEIEPVKRGIYGGAIGYLAWNGTMDTAIAIRTAVLKDGLMHVQAGAGVVADSVPELEWMETRNKARALIRAAELASTNLQREC